MPILDPKTNTVSAFQVAGARPGHAGIARPGPCRQLKPLRRRPIGATSRSGTPGSTTTTPCSTPRAGCGCAATDRARRHNPDFCKKGSDQSLRQGLPARQIAAPGGDARSEDDEVLLHRHLLRARITCNSATTPTTRCGSAAPDRWPAGSTPRCSTRPATRKRRKAGRRACSTPTATASSTTSPSRTQPADPKRISASPAVPDLMP